MIGKIMRYQGREVYLHRSEHQFFMHQINENGINTLWVLHVYFVKFCPLKLFRIIAHFSIGVTYCTKRENNSNNHPVINIACRLYHYVRREKNGL